MSPIIHPLLVELLTEELPPHVLRKLGDAFASGIHDSLATRALLAPGCRLHAYATPRRLAVLLSAVRAQAPDQDYVEKLLPAHVGLNADHQPTPALFKRLAAKGLQHLDITTLQRESDGKQDFLVARGTTPGACLAPSLQSALNASIANLPIPKLMSYQLADGVTTVKFARPAHGLVALFGPDVVSVSVLGLHADRHTQGHRFLCPTPLSLPHANTYVSELYEHGHVIPDFEARATEINRQLHAHAQRLQSTLGDEAEVAHLLEEVTALVEIPSVYVGTFDARFLAIPQECLILTMRRHQKYFPLFDLATHQLTPHFLIVSNMPLQNPAHIIEGNERVVRPRLEDAHFFFETDRKIPLVARVAQLDHIVYHHQLGTQFARVQRLRAIARNIATWLETAPQGSPQSADQAGHADRAAQLAKADLSTQMVAEFPELQGIMGAYYARADGEPEAVVTALRQQYQHRLKDPVQDATLTAAILFMADRLETLVGIWSIGLIPNGERDPYGLRRAALGLISVFEQLTAGGWLTISQAGPLTLHHALHMTAEHFSPTHHVDVSVLAAVHTFIYERYRHQLTIDFDRQVVDAVMAVTPPLHHIAARVHAVTEFCTLPAAASLAATNKRIGNLLKKTEVTSHPRVNPDYLVEPAESALITTLNTLGPLAHQQFIAGDFAASLSTLAQAHQPIDAFFQTVHIMAEDAAVRENRLALLSQLYMMMNQVADISKLVA